MSASAQRFYDYLECLQDEFERRSNASSTPRRFHIYLEIIKGEFDLKSLEVEALRRERDEYRVKVETQMKELRDARCSFVYERGTMRKTSAHRRFVQIRSFDKDTSRDVALSTTCRPTERAMTVPTRPFQPISRAITKVSEPTSISPTVALLPPALASTVGPNSVPKKLGVKIVHKVNHEEPITCVKFSRDGTYLATGCVDGRARIYSVQAGTLTCVLRNLLVEKDPVRTVCFSHDGKYLATGSKEGRVYIWEINKKHVRNAFKGHTHGINSLGFSPNGRLLVSTSSDNTVRLWNMHDGATNVFTEDVPVVLDRPCFVFAMFTPDGRYIAASHRDGTVRVWDVCAGQLMRRIKAHTDWANCLAFTPDGKGLVSGGADKILRYWDVSSLYSTQFRVRSQMEDERPEREFIGHEGIVYSLVISPDGRWVASGSHDASVRIWDTTCSLQSPQCILNHDNQIWTVDFSPGCPAGWYLASGGEEGTLRIWRYSGIGFGNS